LFLEDGTPCEKWQVENFWDIFILDFWEVLTNPKIGKFRVCKECSCLFLSNNNNATYCDLCKKNIAKIRYKNRKRNKERYLHKNILDYLYLIDESKNMSNEFLNESNYYWDVVRKKSVEKSLIYTEKITTKKQYMQWLEDKMKYYKSTLQERK
jgi:hypothetical protein